MRRRVLVGVLSAVVLLAAASLAGVSYVRDRVSAQQQRAVGGMLVDREMLLVHWRNLEPEEHFKSAIQHLTDGLNRQTYSMRFLSPDKSIKKEQPENEFERQVLDGFANRKPEEIAKQDGPECRESLATAGEGYRYFQAIRVEQNCTRMCHVPNASAPATSPENSPIGRAAPGGRKWREGDLMAVAEVTIPLQRRGP